MRFAEVAVDAPTGVSRTFSYSIPDDMRVAPGQLVRVPFGPRTLQGVVFELTPAPQVQETRAVSDTLFDEPIVDSAHISLARWISDYYRCSLFEAVAPMLPPGSRVQTRTVVSIAPDVSDIESVSNSDRQLRVLETVRREERPMSRRSLAAWASGQGRRSGRSYPEVYLIAGIVRVDVQLGPGSLNTYASRRIRSRRFANGLQIPATGLIVSRR